MNWRFCAIRLALACVCGVFCVLDGSSANCADHQESPGLITLASLDVSDTFAFQSLTHPDHTVLIMTVNPMAGVLSPMTFSQSAVYEFPIDLNSDARADKCLRVRFSRPNRRGVQRVVVQFDNGKTVRNIGIGRTGQNIPLRGGGVLRADLFDDPFFFDLLGFQNGEFTGDDFFAGFNVTAIVVEMPTALLGSADIGVWARTARGRRQIDRMGRPAISTFLIPRKMRDAFNAGKPVNDLNDFGPIVQRSIESLSGDRGYAAALTPVLLPDILTFNQATPSGYFNGRRLDDDVIDMQLGLLTLGAVSTDFVPANDVPFRSSFPYLALPH